MCQLYHVDELLAQSQLALTQSPVLTRTRPMDLRVCWIMVTMSVRQLSSLSLSSQQLDFQSPKYVTDLTALSGTQVIVSVATETLICIDLMSLKLSPFAERPA